MADNNFFLEVMSGSDVDIKLERRKSIGNYIVDFLMEKKVDSVERTALLSAFAELDPIDLQDAMFCANIVYSQQMLSELNKHRNMYKKYEMTSKSASSKYKWAFDQYNVMVRTLNALIDSRQSYRRGA